MIHQTICHACALEGFSTPAQHTIGPMHLCTTCLMHADTFAGYPSWSFEEKMERINRMLDIEFPTIRREKAFTKQLENIGW